MAIVNQIFNKLVLDSTVTVNSPSRRAHHNLRIRLHKLLVNHRNLMESIGDDSNAMRLGSRYDAEAKQSTFSLVSPTNSPTYEIIEQDAPIRTVVE